MKKLMVFIFAVLIAGYASAQVKTAMKTTDLNKAITDHIAKNYADYKIALAYKVETNKVVTYEVIVQKEKARTTLVYNAKGEFVKAEVHKATPAKPKSKTTPVQKSTSDPAKTTTKPADTKPKQ